GRAPRDTSSEPEAEGESPPLGAGSVRSVGRRDMIRSTISSGSPEFSDVAISPESEGRLHSPRRQAAMGPLSGFVAGSSLGRHAHRPSLDRWLALTGGWSFSVACPPSLLGSRTGRVATPSGFAPRPIARASSAGPLTA